MPTIENRDKNEAAFRNQKPLLDRTYPQGWFLAFSAGDVVADAETFDELTRLLRAKGNDSPEILVVQAGVEYPETGIIFLEMPSA